jgi:hypothetical protein
MQTSIEVVETLDSHNLFSDRWKCRRDASNTYSSVRFDCAMSASMASLSCLLLSEKFHPEASQAVTEDSLGTYLQEKSGSWRRAKTRRAKTRRSNDGQSAIHRPSSDMKTVHSCICNLHPRECWQISPARQVANWQMYPSWLQRYWKAPLRVTWQAN